MCVCEYVLYKSNIPTAISMQVIESLYTTGWIWNKGCLVYMYNIQTTECIKVIYFCTQIIFGIFSLFLYENLEYHFTGSEIQYVVVVSLDFI